MKIPKTFGEWFEGSPEGKKAIASAAKAEVAERQAGVQGIDGLGEQLKRDLPPLLKTAEVARTKAEKARQNLIDADFALQQALGIVQSLRHQAEVQIGRLELQLRDGAAPEVREFISQLGGLWDSERRNWSWSAPRRNDGTPMPAALRIQQIRGIQERAEALLYEPDSAVAKRELEKLRGEVATSQAAVA